jgi:hypothetical protein
MWRTRDAISGSHHDLRQFISSHRESLARSRSLELSRAQSMSRSVMSGLPATVKNDLALTAGATSQ